MSAEPGASVTVYPDGPLVLRGNFVLQTADGTTVPTQRAALALCRCGRSALKPLCDGSHKRSRFCDPATAADLDRVLTSARPGGAGSEVATRGDLAANASLSAGDRLDPSTS